MSGSVRVVSLLATPVSMHSMMLASSHVRPAAHWDPVMVPGCKTRRPLMQPGLARPQTACASISRSMSDKMRYSFRIRGRLSPSQKAEEAVKRFYNEVWNSLEVDVLDDITHEDLVMHDLCWWEDEFKGRDRCKRVIEEFMTAYKAAQYMIKHCLTSEDGSVVMVHWTVKAVHLGTFLGRPGGGQVINIAGMTTFELRDGLISEMHTFRQSFAGDRAGVGVDPYAL